MKLKIAVDNRYITKCVNILSNNSFKIKEYEFLTHFFDWNGKNKKYIRFFDISFRLSYTYSRLFLCAFMNIYNCIVLDKLSEKNISYICLVESLSAYFLDHIRKIDQSMLNTKNTSICQTLKTALENCIDTDNMHNNKLIGYKIMAYRTLGEFYTRFGIKRQTITKYYEKCIKLYGIYNKKCTEPFTEEWGEVTYIIKSYLDSLIETDIWSYCLKEPYSTEKLISLYKEALNLSKVFNVPIRLKNRLEHRLEYHMRETCLIM